jgi:hypothetical protein
MIPSLEEGLISIHISVLLFEAYSEIIEVCRRHSNPIATVTSVVRWHIVVNPGGIEFQSSFLPSMNYLL